MIPHHPKPGTSTTHSTQAVTSPPRPSRVVPKPIPPQQTLDTRTYQINQLKRRYPSHKETSLPGGTGTSLNFNLVPSDPDFPFDLPQLECDLHIPSKYPKSPAKLHVKNSDIPRGFAINIEKGWDKLVEERKGGGGTLLSLVNGLDKRLEGLLSEEKAETVKLTIFKDTRHLDRQRVEEEEEEESKTEPVVVPPVRRAYIPLETFTQAQIAEAKVRRAQEVRQLEARMGRLQLYHRSSDGIIYTLPLDSKKRAELPGELKGVMSVQLVVPLLYPLQNLRVLLNDVEGGKEGEELAEGVEELFSRKAGELVKKEGSEQGEKMGLVAMVNWLAQRIHLLVREVVREREKRRKEGEEGRGKVKEVEVREAEHAASVERVGQVDRGHLHVIPRPPEWGFGDDGTESSNYDSEDEDDEGGAELGKDGEEMGGPSLPTRTIEKGTAMSFPSIELHGIELLQVSVLSLNVKCDRCKTLNEVTGLKNNLDKASSCKKCATAFTVRYRQELVHMNSTRAGFIDATGCTVADLLPSTFVPACGKCSHPSLGLVSVRGETTTNICRECHARFAFKIPDVKFLDYAPGMHTRLPPTSGPRRKTEKLGLHAGEPLPEKGSCQHYKKSYRWFRFSCCSKVYPCDKCHDAAEEHINEWANRMICGWCSREQNYSVESCAFCGRSVIGKRGSGYWEGGKGTRDKRLMRRGDKRKYRRVGGGETRKD
ncbi:uncharacterized protein PODANS_4_6500 [Podospora anserina S mat+]|uniref:Podospora anserina S mat+ genomic DNA chromosome 4, supercontig 4 n=1 Tax=Podospora anserina (strain S / ATCC MYA-4624 / DSM 980 / FGSC 10383) TaxID=515849 RepID=B2ARS9_PODAN|nr:uncharacterized protein PODANS_4_6500 [Podospora anserina S mat+]CAP66857.1 unnamed protein product [Podospora anserina S mat+]CDP28599.1 Putative protein of unknown function [Podospora anserina S mat+]